MTGRPIPAIPWWASVVAVVFAIVLILKHVQGLLFLPVVLFVLWETGHNIQYALGGLAGDRDGRLTTPKVIVAILLGLAMMVSGWSLLTLAYAGSCAARWYATGSGRRA